MNERCSARRAALRAAVPTGSLLIYGNRETSRNYVANTYPYRPNSHVLYYTGLALPDVALLLDEAGRGWLCGEEAGPDAAVWSGPEASLSDHAAAAGLDGVLTWTEAAAKLTAPHYLPPYRASERLWLAEFLGVEPARLAASSELMAAVVQARSHKDTEEVAEIEEALTLMARMHEAARDLIRPGSTEAAVCAAMSGVALLHRRQMAFEPICSVRGEILHNPFCRYTLEAGQLLVIDMGVESAGFYASDITRTYPVGERFTGLPHELYQLVLMVQQAVIAKLRPGLAYRDAHLFASRLFIEGLKHLGFMRGDTAEALAAGAHALFFTHGLGHMLGLDVHDMEDLGDLVGYEPGAVRSTQFGLNFLRLARPLEPGFVLTVEPGLYFNPELIRRWRAEKRHDAFINYAALDAMQTFGGIRIEDDILITETGARVLGPAIPK